jgi:hypothetical protein
MRIHEGCELVSGSNRLIKQCRCSSTSSGPRFVLAASFQPDGGLVVSATLVPMACDACDSPWMPPSPVQTGPIS